MPFPPRPSKCPVCDRPMLNSSYIVVTAERFDDSEWFCGREDCPGEQLGLPGHEMCFLPAASVQAGDGLPGGHRDGQGEV